MKVTMALLAANDLTAGPRATHIWRQVICSMGKKSLHGLPDTHLEHGQCMNKAFEGAL